MVRTPEWRRSTRTLRRASSGTTRRSAMPSACGDVGQRQSLRSLGSAVASSSARTPRPCLSSSARVRRSPRGARRAGRRGRPIRRRGRPRRAGCPAPPAGPARATAARRGAGLAVQAARLGDHLEAVLAVAQGTDLGGLWRRGGGAVLPGAAQARQHLASHPAAEAMRQRAGRHGLPTTKYDRVEATLGCDEQFLQTARGRG